MSLSWRTTCAIPYLPDYAAASKREAETKPIRGDEFKRKPLGRRDQKYRHIQRLPDNSIGIFDGWSHWQDASQRAPDIQFFENGEIHVYTAPGWNKATPNDVLTEVMGVHVFTEGRKAWIKYDGGMTPLRERAKATYVSGKGWVPPTEESTPSIFRRNEAGRLECLNPLALTTHVVSRKGAKAVRERYMGALDYIDALVRLRRDDPPKWEEIARAFSERFTGEELTSWHTFNKIPEVHLSSFKREHALSLTALMQSDDLNDHYKAYLWLQRGAGHTPEIIKAHADKVLAWVHRDEWFKEREAVVGEKVHDRHAWAFAG